MFRAESIVDGRFSRLLSIPYSQSAWWFRRAQFRNRQAVLDLRLKSTHEALSGSEPRLPANATKFTPLPPTYGGCILFHRFVVLRLQERVDDGKPHR